jgi:hypothetical protein
MANTGVHQSHCCGKHGCKYGDRDCPVKNRQVVQDHACSYCTSTAGLKRQIAELEEELAWSQSLEDRGIVVHGEFED